MDYNDRQLGVLPVGPEGPDDIRVPDPASFARDVQTRIASEIRGVQPYFSKTPSVVVTGSKGLTLAWEVSSPFAGGEKISYSSQITLASLPPSPTVISRLDTLYFVEMAVVVGVDRDPSIAQTFSYIPVNAVADSSGNYAYETITAENTRSVRRVWCLVVAQGVLTPASFWNALTPVVAGNEELYREITPTISSSGYALSSELTLYYLGDPDYVSGATIPILRDCICVAPFLQIKREQEFQSGMGIVNGYQGEEPLTVEHNLKFIGRRQPVSENPAKVQLESIFQRDPIYQMLAKAVLNFTSGSFPGSPRTPGIAAASPRPGSVALANNQRTTFINGQFEGNVHAYKSNAASNGANQKLVTAPLLTSPTGTRFASNAESHRVFRHSTGEEVSRTGDFQNLGGTGALTWIGGANSPVQTGESLYFVPSIVYPRGSGFSIPISRVSRCFFNGSELPAGDIRDANGGDIGIYEEPTGNFFVIYTTDRAGIAYILKKHTLQVDANGILRIPDSNSGCFAFIQGVQGSDPADPHRINKPIVTGLTPSTTVKALTYYVPGVSEIWQFEVSYYKYGGTQNRSFLDGATVVSEVVALVHSQTSALSVQKRDSAFVQTPLTFLLPQLLSFTGYEIDSPIQFAGESYRGPVSYVWTKPDIAPGYAYPSINSVLTCTSLGTSIGGSIAGKIQISGQPAGISHQKLASTSKGQSVFAFIAEKAGVQKLVVATAYSESGVAVLDSSQGTAIDTYDI